MERHLSAEGTPEDADDANDPEPEAIHIPDPEPADNAVVEEEAPPELDEEPPQQPKIDREDVIAKIVKLKGPKRITYKRKLESWDLPLDVELNELDNKGLQELLDAMTK